MCYFRHLYFKIFHICFSGCSQSCFCYGTYSTEGASQWQPCECEHLSVHQLRPSSNPTENKEHYCGGFNNTCVNSNIIFLLFFFFWYGLFCRILSFYVLWGKQHGDGMCHGKNDMDMACAMEKMAWPWHVQWKKRDVQWKKWHGHAMCNGKNAILIAWLSIGHGMAMPFFPFHGQPGLIQRQ